MTFFDIFNKKRENPVEQYLRNTFSNFVRASFRKDIDEGVFVEWTEVMYYNLDTKDDYYERVMEAITNEFLVAYRDCETGK